MKFSVIIPAYNAQACIGRSIESVLNQTCSDWELIVVNNGSNDGTLSEIGRYSAKDRRIKVINCPRNSGSPARPRNLGLREAQGEYVAFLDADDTFLPDKLSEVRDFFADNPDIGLVCHGEEHIKGNAVIRRDYYGPYTTYEDLLFKGNSLSTSAIIMKRECVEKTGFFSEGSEFGGFEDYDYWLRAAKVCRIGYFRKVLGTYLVSESGESSRIAVNCRNALLFLDKQFREYGKGSLYYALLMRKRKALCLRSAGRECMKMRDYKSAVPLLFKGIAHNPLDLKQLAFLLMALPAAVFRRADTYV